MKLISIRANELPAVAEVVKDCVNSGQWVLFTSTTANRRASTRYFLQTEQSVFELDAEGKIVATRGGAELVPEMNEVVYFADLPQPSSLSNGALPGYSSNFAHLIA
jgi:hypothetical protein